MHNCRLTRNVLADYALGEMAPDDATELPAELNDCAPCQADYAAIRNTLRVSRQALRSALPAEEFWPGYHARLQSKLMQRLQEDPAASAVSPSGLSLGRLWMGLGKMATTSVRVPVPAALAVLLLVGILSFSVRSSGQANVVTSLPLAPVETSLKTAPVQVPIIQEREVTQVVYVEKKDRRSKAGSGSANRVNPNAADAAKDDRLVARAGSSPSDKTSMSLTGFKPTDEIKLTIIKGSYRDEK
jgi:anti-sigma factor RsiW